jgi:single-strand DNA-binding protein
MIDSVTLEGHATQDPVLKKTKTGKNVCSFAIAINHNTKEGENRVSYVDVEAWEKLADICATNIIKGKRVMIMGPLRQDRWEGENGKIQSKVKIIANDMRLLENLKKAV